MCAWSGRRFRWPDPRLPARSARSLAGIAAPLASRAVGAAPWVSSAWSAMFRVTIAQFDGATTLRAPPLAAGLLAATLRQEAGLDDAAIEVLAARREPEAVAAVLAEAD